MKSYLAPKDIRLFVVALAVMALSTAAVLLSAPPVLVFLVSAVTLAALASLVGTATDHLGNRFSPGLTGVIQSALGNIPELFFAVFALRAGLVVVVQSALIGSILANALLVLGVAFIVGGRRHGPQRFDRQGPNRMALFFIVSVVILAIPSISAHLHVPLSHHETALSIVGCVVLLALFLLSIPASIAGQTGEVSHGPDEAAWPTWLITTILLAASISAAFAADWFVAALTPALSILHMSQAFAGFVVVAIAGNAVENVVGIQMAAKNKSDYALSIIVQSPLQIIYVLFPILVILATLTGWATFTLVLPLSLLILLIATALIITLVVADGESTWLEGACLVGIYLMVAASFWWG